MSPLLTGLPFAAGGTPKATVTATTGSPTIDTSSRPGKQFTNGLDRVRSQLESQALAKFWLSVAVVGDHHLITAVAVAQVKWSGWRQLQQYIYLQLTNWLIRYKF